MGALLKLVDATLFLLFLVIAIAGPLLDFQTCLPPTLYPDFLVDFHGWYTRGYGDYLMIEKPNFYVGLIWLELLFQWPLALLNLYAMFAAKPWFNTTCLIYGASVVSSMSALMAEMIGSSRASNTLMTIYFPFLGLGALAMLRGLVPSSRKATIAGARPSIGRKKRA